MRHEKRAQWRRLRRVLLAITLLAMFATARLNGGAHYLYCTSMGEITTSCCCAPREGSTQLPSIEGTCCCSAHVIDILPSVDGASRGAIALDAPPAAFVASSILPSAWLSPTPGAVTRPRERGSGPAASRALRRSRLQVYLI